MARGKEDIDQLAHEARQFLASFKTLLMSTVSAEGAPEASYAPFVRMDDDCFYIYVSQLSKHTANIEATRTTSILFIEDERDAQQLFARKRLTFDCRAELIERESEDWKSIMKIFERRFGNIMEMIRPLQDFKLFRIRPQGGIYVKGFAQAYRVSGAKLDSFQHIRTSGTSSKG
ncbi:MAG: HugZ family protein [Acidiferrobacterales bacterium]